MPEDGAGDGGAAPALVIRNLSKTYGGERALNGASLTVAGREVHGLVGHNGSGKSTLIKILAGYHEPDPGGELFIHGEPVALPVGLGGFRRFGISFVHQHLGLVPSLTVVENLEMGAYLRYKGGLRRAVEQDMEYVFCLFPPLEQRREQLAGTLSGGEQQMLSIGRALMGRPKLMLLDEPSLGLAPLLVQEIFRVVKRLQEERSTILLVEQNARAALKISDHGYVLETGEITMKGTGRDLLANEQIKTAYLGKDYRRRSEEDVEE